MQGGDIRATAGVHPDAIRSVERVYELWDAALGAKDVEAAVALYAEDTRLESPLVRHLLVRSAAPSKGATSYGTFCTSCSNGPRQAGAVTGQGSSPTAEG
jgi:hypothetical protein